MLACEKDGMEVSRLFVAIRNECDSLSPPIISERNQYSKGMTNENKGAFKSVIFCNVI